MVLTEPAGAFHGLSLNDLTPALVFWRALAEGALVLDEAHSTLSLPPGVRWFGDQGAAGKLYVRRCYSPIADAILASDAFASGRTVLMGTPGVGKTMFGLYFLWRLLARLPAGHCVVYQSFDGMCAVLRAGSPVTLLQRGSDPLAAVLLQHTTFYVVDGRQPEAARCRTLLITSPRRAVWYEWTKQTLARRLYMPVFSLSELLACRAECHSAVSEATVRALFARWGGSARFTLALTAAAEQAQLAGELSASLRSIELAAVLDALRRGDTGADEVPHRLVHMLQVGPAYNVFHLGFASQYMADRALLSLTARATDAVRCFVRAAQPELHTAALRGHLFEGITLSALALGGRARMRPLPMQARGERQRPPRAADEDVLLPARRTYIFSSVDEFAEQAPPNSLGRPASGCQPTWDALAVDEDTVTLYQVTVSAPAVHGLSSVGLDSLHPLLRTRTRVRLLFVVPPERYAETVAAAPVKGSSGWSERLEQAVLMLLDDAAFDAAALAAAEEAREAAAGVEAAAEGREEVVVSRKRAALLPAHEGEADEHDVSVE